jgi:erythromycin esterase-like protein
MAPAAVIRERAAAVTVESAARQVFASIPLQARLVLIGEATHGTTEFYRIRADLTRLLSCRLAGMPT